MAAVLEAGKPRPGGIAVYGLGGTISRTRQGNLLSHAEELRQRGVDPMSEIAFLRAVGIMPKAPRPTMRIGAADFSRQTGLDQETVRTLVIAGAMDEEDEQFPFRDLRLGREIARLLGRGFPLHGLAEAAALARRHEGTTLGDAGADIEVWLKQATIEISGQTLLPLDESGATLSELLDRAEVAEEARDLHTARRLYEIAVMARPRDAIVRYNLGCVLTGLSELDAAEVHFRIASSLDTSFPEPAFNAAHIRRLKEDADGERRYLEQALEADPDHVEALLGLSRWFIARDDFAAVRPLLERIEQIGTPPAHGDFVRKAMLLCRLVDRV